MRWIRALLWIPFLPFILLKRCADWIDRKPADAGPEWRAELAAVEAEMARHRELRDNLDDSLDFEGLQIATAALDASLLRLRRDEPLAEGRAIQAAMRAAMEGKGRQVVTIGADEIKVEPAHAAGAFLGGGYGDVVVQIPVGAVGTTQDVSPLERSLLQGMAAQCSDFYSSVRKASEEEIERRRLVIRDRVTSWVERYRSELAALKLLDPFEGEQLDETLDKIYNAIYCSALIGGTLLSGRLEERRASRRLAEALAASAPKFPSEVAARTARE